MLVRKRVNGNNQFEWLLCEFIGINHSLLRVGFKHKFIPKVFMVNFIGGHPTLNKSQLGPPTLKSLSSF